MNTKKIVLVLLITLLLINIVFLPHSYATIDEILKSGDDFLDASDDSENIIDPGKLKSTSTTIYKMLLSIAICVSVLVGAVLGIQFMLGSVEGKVKVQEALVPYIIGCFIVFGAFTIWSIVINIGNEISARDNTSSIPGVCSVCEKQLCASYLKNANENNLELYCDKCKKKVTIKPYGM